jgi:hypothetical protein
MPLDSPLYPVKEGRETRVSLTMSIVWPIALAGLNQV